MSTMKFKFGLGDKVKHLLSPYVGSVIGVTRWLNGCTRYGVQSEEMKDGRPVDPYWVDEQELELLEAKPAAEKDSDKGPGGPYPDPPRSH